MSADEYVPSEEDLEVAWIEFEASADDINAASAEVDRAIARIRRDAVEQFIEACKEKRDAPGFLLPVNYFQDLDATIRVAESYVKNYPETGDSDEHR